MLASAAAVRKAAPVEAASSSSGRPSGGLGAVSGRLDRVAKEDGAQLPHASQVIAERSGHYIQYEPDLVVDALASSSMRHEPRSPTRALAQRITVEVGPKLGLTGTGLHVDRRAGVVQAARHQ